MLALPGSASVDELRVMLAADMFIMTEAIAGERVTNGIVTRSITTWLSDREHARQVPPPLPPPTLSTLPTHCSSHPLMARSSTALCIGDSTWDSSAYRAQSR